jgi:hypothetical protein
MTTPEQRAYASASSFKEISTPDKFISTRHEGEFESIYALPFITPYGKLYVSAHELSHGEPVSILLRPKTGDELEFYTLFSETTKQDMKDDVLTSTHDNIDRVLELVSFIGEDSLLATERMMTRFGKQVMRCADVSDAELIVQDALVLRSRNYIYDSDTITGRSRFFRAEITESLADREPEASMTFFDYDLNTSTQSDKATLLYTTNIPSKFKKETLQKQIAFKSIKANDPRKPESFYPVDISHTSDVMQIEMRDALACIRKSRPTVRD